MDTIKKLYQKLWKSLIRPRRMAYCDYDLGGSFLIFNDRCAMRLDFQLKNSFNEEFNISIYIPCDEKEKIKHEVDYVVYCHTHNGNRVEGLYLAEKAIQNDIGFVVFDFRANGFSTGKYVTLGWLEALDINEVVNFLKADVKANSICLWGRSMGGCAILFYLSASYRTKINEMLHFQRKPAVNWVSRTSIQCVIIDSSFPNLIDSISFMVKNKAKQVPEMLVGLVLKVANIEIKEKAGIDLTRINPIDFVSEIRNPIYMIIGNDDELVKYDQYSEMFKKCESKIKKLKLFKGCHADERPEELSSELFDFIKEMFKLKTRYVEIKKAHSISTNEDHTSFFPKDDLMTDATFKIETVDETFDVNRYKSDNIIQNKNPLILTKDVKSSIDSKRPRLKIYDDDHETSILKTNRSFVKPKVIPTTNYTSFINNKPKSVIGTKPVSTNLKKHESPLFQGFRHPINNNEKSQSRDKEEEDLKLKLSSLRVNQEGDAPKWEKSEPIIDNHNETMINFQTDKFSKLLKESNIREKSVEKLFEKNQNEFNDFSIRIKSKPTLANKMRVQAKAVVIPKKLDIIDEIVKDSLIDETLQSQKRISILKSNNKDFSQTFQNTIIESEGPFVPEMREFPSEKSQLLRSLAQNSNISVSNQNHENKNGFNFSDFTDLDQLIVKKLNNESKVNHNPEIQLLKEKSSISDYFGFYANQKTEEIVQKSQTEKVLTKKIYPNLSNSGIQNMNNHDNYSKDVSNMSFNSNQVQNLKLNNFGSEMFQNISFKTIPKEDLINPYFDTSQEKIINPYTSEVISKNPQSFQKQVQNMASNHPSKNSEKSTKIDKNEYSFN